MALYENLPNSSPSLGAAMQARYSNPLDNTGASLASALLGNGLRQQQAVMQGAYQGSRMRDALAQERLRVAQSVKAEAENNAQNSYEQTLSNNGIDQRTAAILSGTLRAGFNPNVVYEALQGQRKYDAQDNALTAAMSGNDLGASRIVSAATLKPLAVTRVEDGTVVNPYASADAQSFASTPIGQSLIGQRNAASVDNLAKAAKNGATISGAMMGAAPDSGTHFTSQSPGGPVKFDLTGDIPPEQRDAIVKAVEAGKDDAGIGADFQAAAKPTAGPGQWTATISPTATAGAANPLAEAMASTIHGDDFLKTLAPADAAQVKALAEGRMDFPSGSALKSPYWQEMLANVASYDPSFEAANYKARSATRKAFTSGKEAQTINALNTVSGHLGDLSDSAQKLNNFGGVLTPLNAPKNWIANAMGDPRIPQFEATKKALVDELTRVYRGTGGSESDIKTWSSALNAANSPEQLQAVSGQINELLHSKINALGDQYRQGMGTIAAQKDFISPHAHSAFDKIAQRSGIQVGSSDISPNTSISDLMQSGHKVGDIISVGGKHYRVTGGDPSDPDVELVQ